MKILKSLPFALALVASAALVPAVTTDARAQVTNIDVQWATSSIQMAGKRANQVPGIKKVPSVGVIRLDIPTVPMFRGDIPDWQEFKIMTQRNAAGVAKLQRALAANPVTAAAITAGSSDSVPPSSRGCTCTAATPAVAQRTASAASSPRRGCDHRNSASAPTTSPVVRDTLG